MTHSNDTAKVVIDEAASRRLAPSRKTLTRPEADFLYLRYEGVGGRRSVWDAALVAAKGDYCAAAVPARVRQDFREICVTLLELRYPDWAAAEGAEGSFVWDLRDDRLIHSHKLHVHQEATERPVALRGESAVLEEDEIPF